MKSLFASNPQLVETTARRNSILESACLIVAARQYAVIKTPGALYLP